MNRTILFELLGEKRSSLSNLERLSEITQRERGLLEEDREERAGIFLYETRDVKKIARLIILLDTLNTSRLPFQIEHSRLFAHAREHYKNFTHVISSDNLRRLIDSYNIFADREMYLRPFDDAYIALKKDLSTIESLAGEDVDTARRLCAVQNIHLKSFYDSLAQIPFQKDRLVRKRYEEAMNRVD
ncbi:MAG: hypothetical protein KKB79_00330 [Nanoarchaeota archaeon]|nr:hypothetical protein [Nanoarchaeota archaeon]